MQQGIFKPIQVSAIKKNRFSFKKSNKNPQYNVYAVKCTLQIFQKLSPMALQFLTLKQKSREYVKQGEERWCFPANMACGVYTAAKYQQIILEEPDKDKVCCKIDNSKGPAEICSHYF